MKKRILGSTSLTLFLVAPFISVAAAQEGYASQAGDGAMPDELDVIIVTGTPIKDAFTAAIEAKREANSVLDVISADAIQRLPDRNLAESLGRVPGLTTQRNEGEASAINVRGAPPRYTSIGIDGLDIPGPDGGRSPRFDSIPSAIASGIVVHKAITPNLPGEAVAGFVDIKLFDPFERQGLAFFAEGGYGKHEIGDGAVEILNGRVSYSNDRLGAFVFGSTSTREKVTDNREYDFVIQDQEVLSVDEIQFRSFRTDLKDQAHGGGLEFRPGGVVERLFVTGIHSEFEESSLRDIYRFSPSGRPAPVIEQGTTGTAPLSTQLRLNRTGNDVSNTLVMLGADFAPGDWKVETNLSYAETENTTTFPQIRFIGNVVGEYDLTNTTDPALRLFDPADMTQEIDAPEIPYSRSQVTLIDANLGIDAMKAKVDVSRDVGWFGISSVLQSGLQYDSREAAGFNTIFTFVRAGVPTDVLADPALLTDVYGTNEAWDTTFDNNIGATYYDINRLFGDYGASVGFDNPPGDSQPIEIDEDIYAAYAMMTSDFSWGNIVYGARVEFTDYTSNGPAIDVAYSDDYVNVLPSVHANIDLSEQMKLRLGFSSAASRPTYNELRASANLNFDSQTATGGNPTLQAEESLGGDISFEWYFDDASLFSAAAFYRSIDNVIYSDSIEVDGGIYSPSEAGETWDLVGFANGQNGYYKGIELNLILSGHNILPAPFDGFGVTGNVAFLDSSFETNNGESFSLLFTSDLAYNVGGFYEKNGFSAQLNYQFRSEYLTNIANNGVNPFFDDQERLDFSARYLLPVSIAGGGVTLFFDANNLTEPEDVRYRGGPDFPNQIERVGRRWVFGARYDW